MQAGLAAVELGEGQQRRVGAELAQRDPGLNLQHLEDRASVIYWRSMMAVYHDDFGYAAPVMRADAQDVPPQWRPQPGAYWFTPAVGSVEVLAAQPASQGDAHDRAWDLGFAALGAVAAAAVRVARPVVPLAEAPPHTRTPDRRNADEAPRP